MRGGVHHWSVVALAGAGLMWSAPALAQGAPIPLLPPSVTAPPPAPAPYQTRPPASAPYQSYQTPPPSPAPYQGAPGTSTETMAPAPDQSDQQAPYTPPPRPPPIVTTPLAPPNAAATNASPGVPSAGAPEAASPQAPSSPAAPNAASSAPNAPGTPAPASPGQTPEQSAESSTAGQPAAPEEPPRWPNVWVPEGAAKLLVLNKIDSLREDLTVKVGQSATYGALTITVKSCMVRPPNQPANATAYLEISDGHKDEPGFSGWTLANQPWLSMLQNPEYNVQVVGCQS